MLAVAATVLVLLGASAYAVPPTRAAIDDLPSPFAGWFEGGEETAPGRALRPEDDGPDWVREQGVGRELERVAVADLDLRYYCDKEPGCPQ